MKNDSLSPVYREVHVSTELKYFRSVDYREEQGIGFSLNLSTGLNTLPTPCPRPRMESVVTTTLGRVAHAHTDHHGLFGQGGASTNKPDFVALLGGAKGTPKHLTLATASAPF